MALFNCFNLGELNYIWCLKQQVCFLNFGSANVLNKFQRLFQAYYLKCISIICQFSRGQRDLKRSAWQR